MIGASEIHRRRDGSWVVMVDGRPRAAVGTLDEALAVVGTPVFAAGPTPGSWTVHREVDDPLV